MGGHSEVGANSLGLCPGEAYKPYFLFISWMPVVIATEKIPEQVSALAGAHRVARVVGQ